MGIIDTVKSWLTIPPASSYLAPIPRVLVEQKWGPFYPVNLYPGVSPAPVYGPAATEALRRTHGGGYASNSAVVACIQAIQRTYVEAPIKVFRTLPDGKQESLVPYPATDLLDRPNPAMTANLVMAYTQYSKAVYGNAYLRKIRNGARQVVELWPLSPAVCWPVRVEGSRNFIDYYAYQFSPDRATIEKIPVEDIVHFRVGLDDRNHMLGMSPLAMLLREVDTDMQATAFSDRLVRNNAVPGLVVTVPTEAGDIGAEAAAMIKQRLGETFGGEGQGGTAVLTGGATAAQFGFDPRALDLTGLHRLPEERISAVLGVPAIIAGLGAGLDRATYANFKEAREMFIEATIIPAYWEDDAVLNEQLLPEFTDDPSLMLKHDITDMRALQQDMDALYTRVTLAVGGKPWLAVNEARTEAGFPSVDGMDEIAQPEPPPTPEPPPAGDQPPPPARRSVKALNQRDFEASLLAMRAAHERELAAALQTWQAGFNRRVALRFAQEAAA